MPATLALVLATGPGFLTSGCAASAERLRRQQEFAASAPVCVGARDCQAKWRAAERWIAAHSVFPLQVRSDEFLQTADPPQHSPNLAVQATREPLGGDRYRIDVKVYCAAVLGCEPDNLLAAIDFNRVVGRARP